MHLENSRYNKQLEYLPNKLNNFRPQDEKTDFNVYSIRPVSHSPIEDNIFKALGASEPSPKPNIMTTGQLLDILETRKKEAPRGSLGSLLRDEEYKTAKDTLIKICKDNPDLFQNFKKRKNGEINLSATTCTNALLEKIKSLK